MVMGHQDTLETVEIQPFAFQDFLHPPEADPGVDENAALFAQEQVAVAAASAGKAQETNHFGSSPQ